MSAEACAKRLLNCWFGTDGWPESIVSDRGTYWTLRFWIELCRLAGSRRKLYGRTERVNQDVQAMLRAYINHNQNDWDEWLPAVQLALNSRAHSIIDMNPFFAVHGYDPPSVVAVPQTAVGTGVSPSQRAKAFVVRITRVTQFCRAAMSAPQQDQERYANRSRRPTEQRRVGDKVYLDLKNVETTRPKKKLDYLKAKYNYSV